MINLEFIRKGNVYRSKISFYGRQVPLQCKFTDKQMPDADNLLNKLVRRWERTPVQRRQLKIFKIPSEAVKKINIDANLATESESFIKGSLNYSLQRAMSVRGDLTALGLSGGGAKALSELGVVCEICSSLAIKPEVFAGTSGGSFLALALGKNPDPETVKKTIYGLVQKYPWTALPDVDLSGLGDISKLNGFMKGKKIIKIFTKEFGLEGLKFSQIENMIFIPATDINSGSEIVFCDPTRTYDALIEDPRNPEASIDEKYVPNIFPADSEAVKAVEKSIRMPIIFTLHSEGPYDFTDGGLLDNNASRMLLSCIDVGKILMVDLGYSNQMEGLFRNKNIIDILFQTIDIMGSVQRQALNDPVCKEDVTIRVINPGLFNVGALESFTRAQDTILSAKATARHILNKLSKDREVRADGSKKITSDPDILRRRFFDEWDKDTIYAIRDKQDGKRKMLVRRYGGPGYNVYYLIENKPKVDDLKHEDYENDGGKIIPKMPSFIDKVKFFSSLAGSAIIGGTINFIKSFFKKKK